MATISAVTIGTDTFSVYALTADPNTDTDSFWNVRLGEERTAWEAASEDDQNRSMVMAADWIDRALVFSGTKTVSTQDRAWPRDDAKDCGTAITSGTTPDALFNAQSFLAGLVLSDTTVTSASGQGSNVKRAKAGSAEVEFFKPTIGDNVENTRLPRVANDYLRCLTEGANGTGAIGAPTASGTSTTSSFACDDYGLSEGFS